VLVMVGSYLPASEAVRARVRRIEDVCARHGVPLIAAALQYPLRHPAVCSVIPGGASSAEVASNVDLLNVDIPEAMWQDLQREGLLPPPRDLK
jgi:D-threo-aldose 1-dehydrogenase